MNRRSLFKRLTAITAAVATAPAVTAEAASDARAQARAEGYARGYDVATARAESRALAAPLTFEAMSKDCERRGCHIETWVTIEELLEPGGMPYWAGHWVGADSDKAMMRQATQHGLAALDAWRRSLHTDCGGGRLA